MTTLTAPRPLRVTCLLVFVMAAISQVGRADDAARQAGSVAPSQSDAVQTTQQMMADGKQPDALRFIDQQLLQRHLDQAGEERYQLLMLKGDALIQTNKLTMASSAYDNARRAAPNGRAAAVARAHTMLIRAAPVGKYTPRTPAGAEPIDIVNPDSRRAAFDALRADLAAAAKPKIARASQGRSLTPAMDLLPAVFDIASLELAAKGSIEQTQSDVASMGEHTRDLVHEQINLCQRKVNGLADRAYTIEEGDRRGLQSNEMKELPPIIAELGRIEKAAREIRRRAQELGQPGTAWEQLAADAADVAEAAERVAEAGAPSTRN